MQNKLELCGNIYILWGRIAAHTRTVCVCKAWNNHARIQLVGLCNWWAHHKLWTFIASKLDWATHWARVQRFVFAMIPTSWKLISVTACKMKRNEATDGGSTVATDLNNKNALRVICTQKLETLDDTHSVSVKIMCTHVIEFARMSKINFACETCSDQ